MITIERIYSRANLVPLDDFIERQYDKNLSPTATHMPFDPASEDPHGPNFRRIGASTWMCAQAALTMLQGQDAMVLAPTNEIAILHAKRVCGFIGLFRTIHMQGDRAVMDKAVRHGMSTLRWGAIAAWTQQIRQMAVTGRIFNDRMWKERAARRALGPFAMIREVRYEGVFNAYAEDNEFLMELAEHGISKFLSENPHISTVGFLRPTDNKPMTTVSHNFRGALSFGSVPTKTMAYRAPYGGNQGVNRGVKALRSGR